MLAIIALLQLPLLSVVGTPTSDAQLPPPGSAQTWFFAEGNTLPNWYEFITIINPDPNNDITVDVEYQLEEPAGFPAGTSTRQLPVAAGQRATLAVYDDLGRAQGAGLGQPGVYTGVSARLTSSGNFVAERPMYFINNFDVGEVNGTHDALGVNAASTTWYFAEGSTLQEPAPGGGAVTPAAGQLRGFMPFFTMQNVSGADANVTITYQTNNPDTVLEKTIPVPNNSRITTDIANAFDNPAYPGSLGAGFEGFGTSIASDQPIIVERPFYTNREFPGIGFVNAASDERGALTANTTTRLFAEGTVLDGFFEFITVFNPNTSDTNLELQYQIEGQTSPEVRTLFVPALARRTVQVYNENSEGGLGRAIPQASAPSSAGVSVRIVSTNGVGFVAERPMYFLRDFGNGPVNGSHDVLGAGVADTSWFFSEGTLRNGFFEFITIQNPNNDATAARLDYFINGQPIATNTRDLPANSRVTVTAFDVNSQGSLAQVLAPAPVPADVDFGLRVTSIDANGRPDQARQIVVERPIYVNAIIAGQPPAINGGHNTLGFQFPAGEVPPLPGQVDADLVIDKDDAPDPLSVGDTNTYTLKVTNNGPAPATGVAVNDILPGQLEFVSYSSTQGTCTHTGETRGGTLTCSIGDMPAGAVVTITVQTVVREQGATSTSASATAANSSFTAQSASPGFEAQSSDGGFGHHSHYRAAHYTWRPVSGNTIEFTIGNSFRRNANPCVNPADGSTVDCTGPPAPDNPGGTPLPGVGDVVQETTGGTVFEFGDGDTNSPTGGGGMLYQVVAIDPARNTLDGLALDSADLPGAVDTTVEHTYTDPGTYLAFSESSARISTGEGHINNDGGSYRAETTVTVGTGNSSPVSSLPPIVQCPQNALCTFQIPGSDPNGDPLRFRFGTSEEASGGSGFVQPGPPHAPNAAAISPSGTYTWDTSGATLSTDPSIGCVPDPDAGETCPTFYSTHVMIEDLDGTGNPKTKAPLDFFIQIGGQQTTGQPPRFDNPQGPQCGATEGAPIGTELRWPIQASDPDAGDTVNLNVSGLPSGATMTPALPQSGNPVGSTFRWTPVAGQEGNYVVTFAATDSTGQQVLCSVTLIAGGTAIVNEASVTSTSTDPDTSDNTDREVTAVRPDAPPTTADMSVTKVDGQDPVGTNSTLTYTIVASNAGPLAAEDVVISDTLPGTVTFVAASAGCNENNNEVTCTIGTLASGASASVVITVTTPGSTQDITNAVSVSSTTPDNNPANNSDTETTRVGVTDLSVTKTDSDDPVESGQTLTYVITVTNNGPSPAQGVSVTDTLPAEVTFSTVSSTAGMSCEHDGTDPGGEVTCQQATLALGGTAIITITVTPTVDMATTITNTVTVDAVTPDPSPGNNTAEEETEVAGTFVFTNSTAITIPLSGAASPYPSEITVSLGTTVVDVDVRLNAFGHSWPDDVDVLLVGPDGQTVELMSDAGDDCDVVDVSLTFDDEAGGPPPNGCTITSGTFTPTDYVGDTGFGCPPDPDAYPSPAPAGPYGSALSVFDGTDPNGVWQLFVVDDCGGDLGSISDGWTLNLAVV